MKILPAALIAFCLAIAPAAIAADKDSPYYIDKRTFKKQYKVIALAPIDADALLQMPDTVARMIEEEITARLKKRGYTVLPSSVLADIRANMEKQVGGFIDSETGQTDVEKVRAVRTHAFRELWFRHKLDAVSTMRVQITQADVESDRGEWDGVKQSLEREGRRMNYTAKVAASTVSFAIYDQTDKPLYIAYGGLEMLMKRVGDGFEPIDPSLYFVDEKRIRKAAQLTVKEI